MSNSVADRVQAKTKAYILDLKTKDVNIHHLITLTSGWSMSWQLRGGMGRGLGGPSSWKNIMVQTKKTFFPPLLAAERDLIF